MKRNIINCTIIRDVRRRSRYVPEGYAMIDRYNRNINYMRVSVTEQCNLRCRYCMPENGGCRSAAEELLTEDEIVTAVGAAAKLGITKIRITGGEPLIKSNIVSICKRIAETDGISELCLTTNGMLLPSLAQELKNAGVKRVNISLDTLDQEKFRYISRGGELKKTLEGIAAALDAGFGVKSMLPLAVACNAGSAVRSSMPVVTILGISTSAVALFLLPTASDTVSLYVAITGVLLRPALYSSSCANCSLVRYR